MSRTTTSRAPSPASAGPRRPRTTPRAPPSSTPRGGPSRLRAPADLTMRVSPSLAPFPGSPPVHVIPWASHGPDGYVLELVAMSTHTGTHVDAPLHFDPGGAEALSGRLERGSRVLVETRWSSRAARAGARYYDGSPGLEPAAARLLARRGVAMVGIDSPSVDPGGSEAFLAHRALARAGIAAVENLRNLRAVRGDGATVAVLPIPLVGASGAPARAVAL
ncbi:MAG: cyclase family protein [Thaumarchaeota archaeon S14]|nr:MAG: cyclase family protein [Thaumarchaeota archaeon S14]